MAIKKEENFIPLEKIVELLSDTFSKANIRISENAKKSKEALAYVASDVTISFPAEFSIIENKPAVKFISIKQQVVTSKGKKAEETKPEIKNVATITINLKPVPV